MPLNKVSNPDSFNNVLSEHAVKELILYCLIPLFHWSKIPLKPNMIGLFFYAMEILNIGVYNRIS